MLLNHDLSSKTLLLNPSYAVSIFQNQQNPSHAIKFHSWLSHVNPKLRSSRSKSTERSAGPFRCSVFRKARCTELCAANVGFRV